MDVPFTRGFVVLCLFQALAVLAPRAPMRLSFLRRRRVLGLVPIAGIGGAVIVIEAVPRAAQAAVDLSTVATPLAAIAGLLSLRSRWLALTAVPAYLLAWRANGVPADAGTDVVIALGCATLAWLSGAVAPRRALAAGIVVATIVDVYQVLVSEQVQVVAQALAVARPVASLPRLQEAAFEGSTMGYGDVYLAALLGVVLATAPWRLVLEAAAVTFVAAVAEGFLFDVVDTLPATVPVALALVYALARSSARGDTLLGSEEASEPWQPPRRHATSGS